MWPLKMTAREAEIQWRWFRMSLLRHSGHFWSFGAFSAIFCQFWPQTQNCRKLIMWPLKNDRKRSRNPMEDVSDGNFNGFRPFQAILCHFGGRRAAQEWAPFTMGGQRNEQQQGKIMLLSQWKLKGWDPSFLPGNEERMKSNVDECKRMLFCILQVMVSEMLQSRSCGLKIGM